MGAKGVEETSTLAHHRAFNASLRTFALTLGTTSTHPASREDMNYDSLTALQDANFGDKHSTLE